VNLFTRLVDNYTDLNWVASQGKRLAIPRNRFIQRIMLYFLITGNTAGTVVLSDNTILDWIPGIRLVKNGETIVNLAAKDLAFTNCYDKGRFPQVYAITTISQTGVTIGEANLTIDFMLNPKNDGDFYALLPAHMLSSLDLFIDWGAAAQATGYTITAGVCKVTLKEVALTKEDLAKIGNIWAVKWTATEKTIDAAYGTYLFPIDLPTGKVIQRAYLNVVNNTVRSDAEIVDPGFKLYDADSEFSRMCWIDAQHALCDWAGIPSSPGSFPAGGPPVPGRIVGFNSLGIERLSPLGLNATGYKAGDLRVGFNTLAPTAVSKVRLITKELS